MLEFEIFLQGVVMAQHKHDPLITPIHISMFGHDRDSTPETTITIIQFR
jgi:hypothetical protein